MTLNFIKKNILLILLLLISRDISASEISLIPSPEDTGSLEELIVDVILDTENKNINAVDGVINIEENIDVVGIDMGNSVIDFWIERPETGEDNIVFSGVTPGGFNGDNINMFSFMIKSEEDNISIEFDNVDLYLNDGLGTRDVVSLNNLEFDIKNKVYDSKVIVDNIPPENFVPIISSDKNIFDGKLFVSFTAQDKESGINRYEVLETYKDQDSIEKDKNWVISNSPYLIKDQKLKKNIYVKAIDNSDNYLVVKANEGSGRNNNIFVIIVIILVILKALHVLRKKMI